VICAVTLWVLTADGFFLLLCLLFWVVVLDQTWISEDLDSLRLGTVLIDLVGLSLNYTN
jgi:hypothetical protein